ncbi:MFS transporter [Streptomyces sp. NPDC055681]
MSDNGSGPPRVNAIVGVLALGGITVSLMHTLLVPIVADLPTLLGASASNTSWVITATLLAGAVSTPVMGRLGDMIGKRRILLVCLVLQMAGSVVCALSGSLAPVIVGRALQGCAVGVIPLGISIMRDELPAERLGSATALMSASLGVGGALGQPIAAVVAQHAHWHVLFWMSAGLSAMCALLVLTLIPASTVHTGGRFDLIGSAGLAAGLVCLLLAVSKGTDWGWGSGPTLGLFAAAVVVLLVWGSWELRIHQPLVDLRTTARRQVLLTNLASVLAGLAMFAMSLVFPQLLQMPKATGYGLGQTILTAGLCLGPAGLIMMAVSLVSARITAARGPRTTLMLGAVVLAAGYGLGVVLMAQVWQIVLVSCVISGGIGLAYGTMPALIMSAVLPSETAAANGLNSLMRSLGTSISSAICGAVLAHMTITLGTYTVPSQNGFRVTMAIGGGAAVLALAVAAFLPGRHNAPAAVAASKSAAMGQVDAARAVEGR